MTITLPNNYVDRFDILKNYKKLFFLPGLGLQSAELNELQDFIRSDLQILATYLVGDGKIVTGGSVLSLLGTNLSMDAAGCNIQGHICQVPAAVVTIVGVGLEYVGIATLETLVTPNEDPTLVETVPTSPNVGQSGAYRDKISGRWCTSAQLLTGEVFFPIITLKDGVIIATSTSTGTEFSDLLNQYDKEVRGSAVLNGLNVSYNSTDLSTGIILMKVGSGKARVRGIPITVPYQQFCALSPIADTNENGADPYIYVIPPSSFTLTPSTTGGTLPAATYYYKVTAVTSSLGESFASTSQSVTTTGTTASITINWTAVTGATTYKIYGRTTANNYVYITTVSTNNWIDTGAISPTSVFAPSVFSVPANYNPVQNIIRINGNKTASNIQITKGVSNGVDIIPSPPGYTSALSVVAITSVIQGGTTYSATTDYALSGAFSIDWSKTGAEPISGSTYTITYIYSAVVNPPNGNTFLSPDQNNIVIDQTNIFVNNATIYLDYNFYLKRIDRLNIDPYGNYIINKGSPNYFLSNLAPVARSSDYLSLATVTLVYNQTPIITTDTITNLLVSDLNSLQQQLSVVQQQVANLALINSTASVSPTSIKRGTFVDPLIDTSKMDSGLTNTAVQFPDTSSITGTYSLTMASNFSLLGLTSAWITLPYTETVYYTQSLRTGSRQINPYSSQANSILTPNVKVNPPVKYGNEIYWYFHGSFIPYSTIVQVICTGFQPGEIVNITLGPSGPVYDSNSNGFQLVQIPTTASVNGTADSVTGNVTIPLTINFGFPTGIYLVTATGQTSNAYATTTLSLLSNPVGINGNYTINDYYNWGGTNPIPYGFDPIAETYNFSDAVDFTSIGLYVTTIPNADLQVRIVHVSYGIPDTTTIDGQGSIAKNSIVLGNNKLVFNAPISNVPNTDRAITVLTATNIGSVATAKMGYTDIPTGKLVTSQPSPGVLQLSSNYSTWTPVQDEDLTYTFYKANYNTNVTTTALITTANVTNYTDWYISGTVKIPSGTTCSFYLQDTLGNKYPIFPNVPLYTSSISGVVTLYVTMKTVNANVSPIIPVGLELLGGTAVNPSIYTSIGISVPNGTVSPAAATLVIASYNPLNNGVQPQLATDTGGNTTWTNMTFSSSVALGNGWNEVTYSYSGLSTNITRVRIIESTTNTSIRPKITNIRLILV